MTTKKTQLPNISEQVCVGTVFQFSLGSERHDWRRWLRSEVESVTFMRMEGFSSRQLDMSGLLLTQRLVLPSRQFIHWLIMARGHLWRNLKVPSINDASGICCFLENIISHTLCRHHQDWRCPEGYKWPLSMDKIQWHYGGHDEIGLLQWMWELVLCLVAIHFYSVAGKPKIVI